MTNLREAAKSGETNTRGAITRRRIVAAAVQTFAEKGFEAASTRAIAERANTDQGLLTYHFRSKDDLWRAAADHVFGILLGRLDTRLAGLEVIDRRERAREAVREYVRFVAAHPEFFRFMVDEGNRTGPRMRWLADTHIKPRFQFMKDQGIARATDVDDALVPHAFYALAGAASLLFAIGPTCRRVTGIDPRKSEVIEAHADYVAKLMVP